MRASPRKGAAGSLFVSRRGGEVQRGDIVGGQGQRQAQGQLGVRAAAQRDERALDLLGQRARAPPPGWRPGR